MLPTSRTMQPSPPTSPPPLPPFNKSKRYRINPKTKFTTCITRISKRIIQDTETIAPNTEPPWWLSKEDLLDRVKIFTPGNCTGMSVKEEWANAHIELAMELEEHLKHLLVYSDGLLSEKNGMRHTGLGLVGYHSGARVFKHKEALGEHTEVYDAEMASLQAATTEARHFIKSTQPDRRPNRII